jgi:hypothetical protein
VFYGYDSVHQQVNYSASEFRDFLTAFLAGPAASINPTIQHLTQKHPWLQRDAAFRYTSVVLVAHSLGAIVVRGALLESLSQSWLDTVRLVLFAPAHKGAFVWKLLLTSLTGVRFGQVIGSVPLCQYE